MKIAVIGYSGAGKSTTAKLLANYYNCPLLYLDKVQFLPNWVERGRDEARVMVKNFLDENDCWIIDGNYPKFCQAERLEHANKILFFSFNRFTCFFRALRRFRQFAGKTRESVAEGCIEKVDFEFACWILYKGRTAEKRRYYKSIERKFPQKFIRFKNQKQVDTYLRKMGIEPISAG